MKQTTFFTAAVLVCFFNLAGCSTFGTNEAEATNIYIGWVRFHGEFFLYKNYRDFLVEKNGSCISGALPLDKQNIAAEKLDGKKVRIVAEKRVWDLPSSLALSLNHGNSPIVNRCAQSHVLFASDMFLDK